MEYKDYEKRLQEYVISTQQSKLLLRYSMLMFNDIPSNLSIPAREAWNNDLKKINDKSTNITIKRRSGEIKTGKAFPYKLLVELVENKKCEPYISIFQLLFALKGKGLEFFDIDYTETLLSQYLIVNLAYLEAFLNDSIRLMCILKPNNLKSRDRKHSWEEIIEAENWGNLLSDMIEIYVRNLGNVEKKIKSLRKEFKLKIKFDESDYEKLIFYMHVRNSFIHNGGIVTNDIIKYAKNEDLVVGEKIKIDFDIISEVITVMESTAYQTFSQVSTKYFNQAKDIIPNVPCKNEWHEE